MKAFIFDMDGTLLDTNGLWWELPAMLLARDNIQCPQALQSLLGKESCGVMARHLINARVLPYTMEEIWPIFYGMMEEQYRSRATWAPGAQAMLLALQRQGIPCCVATATPLQVAFHALETCGVLPYIAFAQSCHTLALGKDKPAFFHAIAQQFGVPITECVVVEDALYAIRSAKKAGATVWAIADRWMADDWTQIQQVADQCFERHADLLEYFEKSLA